MLSEKPDFYQSGSHNGPLIGYTVQCTSCTGFCDLNNNLKFKAVSSPQKCNFLPTCSPTYQLYDIIADIKELIIKNLYGREKN